MICRQRLLPRRRHALQPTMSTRADPWLLRTNVQRDCSPAVDFKAGHGLPAARRPQLLYCTLTFQRDANASAPGRALAACARLAGDGGQPLMHLLSPHVQAAASGDLVCPPRELARLFLVCVSSPWTRQAAAWPPSPVPTGRAPGRAPLAVPTAGAVLGPLAAGRGLGERQGKTSEGTRA